MDFQNRIVRLELAVSSLYESTVPLLDVEETAKFLRITPRSVYTRVHRKQLHPVRLGGKLYFRKLDLVKSLDFSDEMESAQLAQAG